MTDTETATEVREVMPEYRRDQIEQRNTRPKLFDDEDLRSIKSFEDVAALVKARDLPASRAQDLGHGFALADDKSVFVGREMMILDWRYYPSDKGSGEFVTLQIVTKDGGKYIVNDGSTGIMAQCKLWDKAEVVLPMWVPKGFRVSEYDYENAKGEKSRAKTYYISTDV